MRDVSKQGYKGRLRRSHFKTNLLLAESVETTSKLASSDQGGKSRYGKAPGAEQSTAAGAAGRAAWISGAIILLLLLVQAALCIFYIKKVWEFGLSSVCMVMPKEYRDVYFLIRGGGFPWSGASFLRRSITCNSYFTLWEFQGHLVFYFTANYKNFRL